MPTGNRPAEVFGYPIENHSEQANQIREKHWCPFVDQECNKRSRLLNYPLVFALSYITVVCALRAQDALKSPALLIGYPMCLKT